MATASIGKLNVQLTASADQFNRVIDHTGKNTAKFKQTLSEINKQSGSGLLAGIGGAAKWGAAAIGIGSVGGAVTGLGRAFKNAAASADELHDTAEVFGLSPDQLQGFRMAAGGMEVFDKIFEKFLRSVGEGNKGFERLGLSAKRLQDMAPVKAWLVFVDALNKVNDASEKTSIRMEILGRGSASIAERLNKGTGFWEESVGSILGHGEKVRELGEKYDEFEIKTDRLKQRFTNAWQEMGVHAAENLTIVANALDSAAERLGTFLGGGDAGAVKGKGMPPGFLAQQEQRAAARERAMDKQRKAAEDLEKNRRKDAEELSMNVRERLSKRLADGQPITDQQVVNEIRKTLVEQQQQKMLLASINKHLAKFNPPVPARAP